VVVVVVGAFVVEEIGTHAQRSPPGACEYPASYQWIYPLGQVQQFGAVVVGEGPDVVLDGVGTHAQGSLGCGNPKSYQWLYPLGQVQQLWVGAVVVVAAGA